MGSFVSGEAPWEQLILSWAPPEEFTLANWIPWEGAALARGMVDEVLAGTLAVGLLLGPEGSGKSHLLRAAAAHGAALWGAGAVVYWRAGGDPSPDGEEAWAKALDRVGFPRLLAVDGVERLSDSPQDQEWAFHLFNRTRGGGGGVLWASREDPSTLVGLRPELRSRILWGGAASLSPPSEAMLTAILGKLARDRQVVLSEELIRYLALRLPRRVAAYEAALSRLDQEGLKRGRALTIPLAREVLQTVSTPRVD